MLSGVTVFYNNINDGQMIERERKFTKSQIACESKQSTRESGVCFKTKRTDVLRRILNLGEQGWDLGKVKRFRVEHGVVSAVVHSIKDDLELDDLVGRRQLRLND